MRKATRLFIHLPQELWRMSRNRVTLVGRSLILAAVASSVGLLSMDHLLYQIFIVLASLLAVAIVVGLLCRPRLELQVSIPEKVSAGDTVAGHLKISNRSRRCGRDIDCGFERLPEAIQMESESPAITRLEKGESVSLPFELVAPKRGVFHLSAVWAASVFPFHLFRLGRSSTPTKPLTVFPSFTPLDELRLTVVGRLQSGGLALAAKLGESMEYTGNRIYRPGDSSRRLDYRSWARLGVPVIREFHEEYYCRVAVVLDTFAGRDRTSTSVDNPNLEAAISLAAAITEVLSKGEYLIDLFAAGPDVHFFESGRRRSHFENVLEILACLEESRSDPFSSLGASIADQLAQISSVVVVLLDWTSSRREFIQQIAESGCVVKLIVVRDGPTSELLESSGFTDATQLTPEAVVRGGLRVL